MEELKKLFEDYDLPMILDLKESIDFTLSMLEKNTDYENLLPLLSFNASLSQKISEITIELDDELLFFSGKRKKK